MQFPRHGISRRRLLTAACLAPLASSAWAWPSERPLRILVPAPAGGTMDVVARAIAEQLGTEIGRAVVVDNRPGAGGAIAVQALRAAPADGQTLMVTASNVLTEIPHVLKSSFNPLTDLKPVAAVARGSLVLVGPPALNVPNVKALVEQMKAQKDKFNSYASYSAGTASHYAGLIFSKEVGLDLTHVPYAGSPPALVEVISGRIPIMFDGIPTSKPMLDGGKLKAFAVTAPKRSAQLPDVPTMAEAGYPDIVFSNWVGVVGVSGLPADLVNKIHAVVTRVAAHDKVRQRLQGLGFDMADSQSPEQLAQEVRTEFERNADIVKKFNIRLNP